MLCSSLLSPGLQPLFLASAFPPLFPALFVVPVHWLVHIPAHVDAPQKVTARVNLPVNEDPGNRSSVSGAHSPGFLRAVRLCSCLRLASGHALPFRTPVPWQSCLVLADSLQFPWKYIGFQKLPCRYFYPLSLLIPFPHIKPLFQLSGSTYSDFFFLSAGPKVKSTLSYLVQDHASF